MSTNVTGVITQIENSNPLIHFTESTSDSTSTHDAKFTLGYDTANDRFAISTVNKHTSTEALDNPVLYIDETTEQIGIGGFNPLIDAGFNLNHGSSISATANATGSDDGVSCTTAAGALLYIAEGDTLYSAADGTLIGPVDEVTNDTSIKLAYVAQAIQTNDIFVSRNLVWTGVSINDASVSNGDESITVTAGAVGAIPANEYLFVNTTSAPYYKILGKTHATDPNNARSDTTIRFSATLNTAAAAAAVNGLKIYVNRPKHLSKITEIEDGTVGAVLTVNQPAGYPIGTGSIEVNGANATNVVALNTFLYNSKGQFVGEVTSVTNASTIVIKSGTHVSLANSEVLYTYMQHTGVRVVGSVTKNTATAITVNGTDASLAFKIGDKLANKKGEYIGVVTTISSATSIILNDNISPNGGCRYALADNTYLYKFKGSSHFSNRTGELFGTGAVMSGDLICKGSLKAGHGSFSADETGIRLTSETASGPSSGGLVIIASDDGNVMADDDRLGVIEFKGAVDINNTLSIGARIQAVCRDAWDGSNNDADLEFYTTNVTTESKVLTLDADKLATFAGGLTTGSAAAAAHDLNATTFDLDATGAVTIDSSGGAISIGADDIDQAINIGTQGERDINIATGAFEDTVTIGNVTGATAVNLNAGTGGISLASTGAGDIVINSDDTLLLDADGVLELNSSAGAISIGNDADAHAINVGTGGAARIITIGNVTGATAVNLNAGTGGMTVDCTDGGAISLDANGAPSNFTLVSTADEDDLTIAVTGNTNSSLLLSSTGTGADAMSLDVSAGSMVVAPSLADGQTLKLGKNGAVEMIFTPHETAGNEKFSLTNTAGTAADAIAIDAVAGGISLDGAAGVTVTSTGGTLLLNGTGQTVDLNAAALDIDSTDTTNLTMTANDASEKVLTIDAINSNGSGTAKIALGTTSGTAVSIGHTTSEVTVNDNLTVEGDLTVNGTTTTVSTTNTVIEDARIELGNGTSGTPTLDAGIIIERGNSNNLFMGWDHSNTAFALATCAAETGATEGNDLTLTDAALKCGAGTFSGRVLVDDTTEASNITTASLQTDGGLAVVKAAIIGIGLSTGQASAGAHDLNATTFDLDATGAVTIDAADDSNLTVAGNGKDLNIVVSGGGAQTLIASCAGTGDDAIQLTASAGGMDITSAGVMDITSTNSVMTLASGTGDLNISADGAATIVNLATGAGAKALTVGSTNSTSATTVQCGSGAMTFTAGGAFDVNATNAVTLDSSTAGFSIDGVLDSNLTVAASGQDLDIAVTGGGEQELRLASAGTGSDAIKLNASAGGINIDATGAVTIDAADDSNLTVAGNGKDLNIVVSGGGAQTLIASCAGTGDDAIQLTASAGGMDITSAGVMDITSTNSVMTLASGTGDLNISADGAATIVNLATGAGAKALTVGSTNSTSATTVQCGSGAMTFTAGGAFDVNATNAVTLDSSTAGFSIDGVLDSNLTVAASGQDLDIAVTGGGEQELRLASAGTGSDAIKLNASAGGINIDATGAVTIDAADDSNLTVAGNGKDLNIVVSGGGAQTLIASCAGTGDDAIQLTASAGGMDITSAGVMDITSTNSVMTLASGTGDLNISADGAATIVNLATGAGAKALTVGSTNSTSATTVQCGSGAMTFTAGGAFDVNATNAVTLDSSTAGFSIDGVLDSNLTVAASGQDLDIAVTGGGEQELRLASAGTGSDAIKLNASAGGINIDAAGALQINSSAGAVQIANDNTNGAVNIGDHASATKTITLGGHATNTTLTTKGAMTHTGAITVGVDGTGYDVKFFGDSNNAYMLWDASEDTLEVAGDGEILCSSDATLKKDITNIENATEKLSELNGVSFKWRSSEKDSFGVIAQDVERVLPSAVHISKNNGKRTVNYNAIIGLLVEGLKEQNERYATLEKQFEEFQNKE